MRLNCTETPTRKIGTFARHKYFLLRPGHTDVRIFSHSPVRHSFSLLFHSQEDPRLGKFDFKDLLATDTNTRLSRHSAA